MTNRMKYKIYAVLRALGLIPIVAWWEQRKLDRARIAKFEAFCKKIGAKKVNGHWTKDKDAQ